MFAAQAATAIAVTRAQRELPRLLRSAFSRAGGDALSEAQLDALVSAAESTSTRTTSRRTGRWPTRWPRSAVWASATSSW